MCHMQLTLNKSIHTAFLVQLELSKIERPVFWELNNYVILSSHGKVDTEEC